VTAPRTVVEAHGLVKRFGDLVAVDGIDFEIVEPECFGFLGPNGAGKTSTIRMITCVSPITAGELRVLGRDPRREPRVIKGLIGVVPQEDNLDPDLTVLANLLVYARYFDLPAAVAEERAWENLRLMALEEKASERIEHLSGGLKRRLTVARALINQPSLLVLDEPTTGLDPQARHLVWQKLRQLKRQGVTMVLTTHNMEEAAQLCDRVVVMDRSHIIARGRPAELVATYVGEQVLEVRLGFDERERTLALLRELVPGREMDEVEDTVYVYAQDGQAIDQAVVSLLERRADQVTLRRATLEDVFLRLTGRGLIE